jgi:hypothetical protein
MTKARIVTARRAAAETATTRPVTRRRRHRVLPRSHRGAVVVRGRCVDLPAYDEMMSRAVGRLDWLSNGVYYLVVRSDASGDFHVFVDHGAALDAAKAMSCGNVDHRVLTISGQVLVVATENELQED